MYLINFGRYLQLKSLQFLEHLDDRQNHLLLQAVNKVFFIIYNITDDLGGCDIGLPRPNQCYNRLHLNDQSTISSK